jgi:hypothetical protein
MATVPGRSATPQLDQSMAVVGTAKDRGRKDDQEAVPLEAKVIVAIPEPNLQALFVIASSRTNTSSLQ